MSLTSQQALWAATRGGALALELPDQGHLAPGSAGDLVVLDAPSPDHIPYRPGTNLVWKTIKSGRVVSGGGR
jgi:imidazolonepropionase